MKQFSYQSIAAVALFVGLLFFMPANSMQAGRFFQLETPTPITVPGTVLLPATSIPGTIVIPATATEIPTEAPTEAPTVPTMPTVAVTPMETVTVVPTVTTMPTVAVTPMETVTVVPTVTTMPTVTVTPMETVVVVPTVPTVPTAIVTEEPTAVVPTVIATVPTAIVTDEPTVVVPTPTTMTSPLEPPTAVPTVETPVTVVPTVETPVTAVPTVETPGPSLSLAAAEAAAIRFLSSVTGIPISNISVVSSQSVAWADGSLGCPKAGVTYAAGMISGYEITVDADGASYRIHVRADVPGYAFICTNLNGSKLPTSTPAAVATATLNYTQNDPTATATLHYTQGDPTATATLHYAQNDPTATMIPATYTPTKTPVPTYTSTPTYTPLPTYTPTATPYIPSSGLQLEGRWVQRVVGDRLSSSVYGVVDIEGMHVLYRSRNDGTTWQQVAGATSGLDYAGLSAIGQDEFVMNASDSNILYSGSNESCADMATESAAIVDAAPMYKSENGGISWDALPDSMNMRPLLSHAYQPNVLFATDCVWIYVTTDGGQTWAPTPSLAETDAFWNTYRAVSMIGVYDSSDLSSAPALTKVVVGARSTTGAGIIVESSDLGGSWSTLTPELEPAPWEFTAMALSGDSIWFIDPSGFWSTKDGGMTWVFTNRGLESLVAITDGVQSGRLNALIYHPSEQLYLGTSAGLYRSSTGTTSWEKITGTDFDAADVDGIVFTGNEPNLIYINSADGVYVARVQ